MNKNKKIVTFDTTSDDNLQLIKEKIKKHQIRLFIAGSLAVIISIFVFFYRNNKINSEKTAQTSMFHAVMLFEKENYTDAIHGTESITGLLDISQKHNRTKAANLANFYIGVSYLKLGEYDNSIEYLTKVSFKDYIMQAKAIALIGNAYMEKDDYKKAVKFYEDASILNPNKTLSPAYLEKAAIAYEANNDIQEAIRCYEAIYKKYSNYKKNNVIKHIERLKSKSSNI